MSEKVRFEARFNGVPRQDLEQRCALAEDLVASLRVDLKETVMTAEVALHMSVIMAEIFAEKSDASNQFERIITRMREIYAKYSLDKVRDGSSEPSEKGA